MNPRRPPPAGPGCAFHAATAAGGDWRQTAAALLERLRPPEGANLGLIYATDLLADDLGSVITLLRQVTGIEAWVGSVGIGICGDQEELFDVPAASVLAARLPDDAFRLIRQPDGAAPDAAAETEWRRWLATQQGPRAPLALVHADPRSPRLAERITDLATDSGAFLVGGFASSRNSYPLFAGERSEGGIAGVLFGGAVETVIGLSQGCTPIGPVRTITACEDSVIQEIDGRPALEAFRQDVGTAVARNLRRAAGYIFAALPVSGSDTGDYLVRNLVGIDPTRGWIAIGQPVAPGDPILFTRRDREAAVADLDRMLDDVGRRLGGRQPQAAVYVSCLARGPNLFGPNAEEVRQVQAAIGRTVPLVGVFSNAEIASDRLYGYTGVLSLFL